MTVKDEIEAAWEAWEAVRKPAHLFDFKDEDGFKRLFADGDPLSDRNCRTCWWNEPPPFYPCGILMMWHPMLFAQTRASTLNACIRPLFEGFEVEEVFLWQDALTRWVYLSRQDPNHDEDGTYVDTRYVERVTLLKPKALPVEGTTLSFEIISAS